MDAQQAEETVLTRLKQVFNRYDNTSDASSVVSATAHSQTAQAASFAVMEVVAVGLVLEALIAIRTALCNAKSNVNKCAHLAKRLEVLEPVLRKASGPGHYVSQAQLQPLARLIDEIKPCVAEFNRVNKKQKLARVWRAGEFKEKFASFNQRLSEIVADLTAATVLDSASFARQTAAEARGAAAAEREDLKALAAEVKEESKGLVKTLLDAEGRLADGPLAQSLARSERETRAALETLRGQANAQTAQLRALAAQGLADATELSAKLDAVSGAAAAAAAAAHDSAEESAAALAEELQKQHAEATARLEFIISAAENTLSAEARARGKRQAEATREAMKASQTQLMAAIQSCRSQEMEALEAIIRTGSKEAREAATELREGMGALKELHGQQLRVLNDVARDMAELKAMMASVPADVKEALLGVNQLLEMMKKMQVGSTAEAPAARKEKLLRALRDGKERLTRTETRLLEVYGRTNAKPELQTALKSLTRQVALVAASMSFLEEKSKMLAHAEQTPNLAVAELTAAIEQSCGSVSDSMAHANASALEQPLRYALRALADANGEADLALRGSAADAAGDMPAGWARELWVHAFGRTIWSGTRAMLLEARDSYKGAAVDDTRFQPFMSLKQQDFTLGAGDRVDALEWRAMASAAKEDTDLAAMSNANSAALAAQLAMDRFLAQVQRAADGFNVFITLRGQGERTRSTSTAFAQAYLGDLVFLEVWATHDCFIYIVEQDCSGAICAIMPNNDDPNADNFVRANEHRIVPDKAGKGDQFSVEFCEPAGLERVVVVASRTQWSEYATLVRGGNNRQLMQGMRTVLSRGCKTKPDPIDHGTTVTANDAVAVAELRFNLLARN